MRTVVTEAELDELDIGVRLRFTVSKKALEKVTGGLWKVENVKGVFGSDDICRNRTPLEVLDATVD